MTRDSSVPAVANRFLAVVCYCLVLTFVDVIRVLFHALGARAAESRLVLAAYDSETCRKPNVGDYGIFSCSVSSIWELFMCSQLRMLRCAGFLFTLPERKGVAVLILHHLPLSFVVFCKCTLASQVVIPAGGCCVSSVGEFVDSAILILRILVTLACACRMH